MYKTIIIKNNIEFQNEIVDFNNNNVDYISTIKKEKNLQRKG